MEHTNQIPVLGIDGPLGWVDANDLTSAEPDIFVHLPDGRVVLAPLEMIQRQPDGSCYLPLSQVQIGPGIESRSAAPPAAAGRPQPAPLSAAAPAETPSRETLPDRMPPAAPEPVDEHLSETIASIPLAAEQVQVEKNVTSRPVNIAKHVSTRVEHIEDTGYREEVRVERVPVNQPVEKAPEVRKEGDTTVIPLVEEVLVVEKRLFLREEVRITMTRVPNEPVDVELRLEELEVERQGNTDPDLTGFTG